MSRVKEKYDSSDPNNVFSAETPSGADWVNFADNANYLNGNGLQLVTNHTIGTSGSWNLTHNSLYQYAYRIAPTFQATHRVWSLKISAEKGGSATVKIYEGATVTKEQVIGFGPSISTFKITEELPLSHTASSDSTKQALLEVQYTSSTTANESQPSVYSGSLISVGCFEVRRKALVPRVPSEQAAERDSCIVRQPIFDSRVDPYQSVGGVFRAVSGSYNIVRKAALFNHSTPYDSTNNDEQSWAIKISQSQGLADLFPTDPQVYAGNVKQSPSSSVDVWILAEVDSSTTGKIHISSSTAGDSTDILSITATSPTWYSSSVLIMNEDLNSTDTGYSSRETLIFKGEASGANPTDTLYVYSISVIDPRE